MSSSQCSSQEESTPSTLSDQKRTIDDVLREQFPSFDQQAIAGPFAQEDFRDLEYQKELTRMMIDVLIQFHAWASVRPTHERNAAAVKLENQINTVIKIEEEQERTRQQILQFVAKMRSALDALKGISA